MIALRLVFAIFFLFFYASSTCFAFTAKEIIQKSDALLRGKSNYFKMMMQVKTPEWERQNIMEGYMQGYDLSFVEFLAPAKDKGTKFLKVKYNLWMYLSRIERTIKIPPTMMKQSMMGSDFSYDDLVKESSIVHDYIHKIVAVEKGIYTIDLIPKENAPVVYGKLKYWVREDFIPVKVEYYNEKGKLIKTLKYSQVKKMGGRTIPTVMIMRDLAKKDHQTILTYLEAKFDILISDQIFTQRNLMKK